MGQTKSKKSTTLECKKDVANQSISTLDIINILPILNVSNQGEDIGKVQNTRGEKINDVKKADVSNSESHTVVYSSPYRVNASSNRVKISKQRQIYNVVKKINDRSSVDNERGNKNIANHLNDTPRFKKMKLKYIGRSKSVTGNNELNGCGTNKTLTLRRRDRHSVGDVISEQMTKPAKPVTSKRKGWAAISNLANRGGNKSDDSYSSINSDEEMGSKVSDKTDRRELIDTDLSNNILKAFRKNLGCNEGKEESRRSRNKSHRQRNRSVTKSTSTDDNCCKVACVQTDFSVDEHSTFGHFKTAETQFHQSTLIPDEVLDLKQNNSNEIETIANKLVKIDCNSHNGYSTPEFVNEKTFIESDQSFKLDTLENVLTDTYKEQTESEKAVSLNILDDGSGTQHKLVNATLNDTLEYEGISKNELEITSSILKNLFKNVDNDPKELKISSPNDIKENASIVQNESEIGTTNDIAALQHASIDKNEFKITTSNGILENDSDVQDVLEVFSTNDILQYDSSDKNEFKIILENVSNDQNELKISVSNDVLGYDGISENVPEITRPTSSIILENESKVQMELKIDLSNDITENESIVQNQSKIFTTNDIVVPKDESKDKNELKITTSNDVLENESNSENGLRIPTKMMYSTLNDVLGNEQIGQHELEVSTTNDVLGYDSINQNILKIFAANDVLEYDKISQNELEVTTTNFVLENASGAQNELKISVSNDIKENESDAKDELEIFPTNDIRVLRHESEDKNELQITSSNEILENERNCLNELKITTIKDILGYPEVSQNELATATSQDKVLYENNAQNEFVLGLSTTNNKLGFDGNQKILKAAISNVLVGNESYDRNELFTSSSNDVLVYEDDEQIIRGQHEVGITSAYDILEQQGISQNKLAIDETNCIENNGSNDIEVPLAMGGLECEAKNQDELELMMFRGLEKGAKGLSDLELSTSNCMKEDQIKGKSDLEKITSTDILTGQYRNQNDTIKSQNGTESCMSNNILNEVLDTSKPPNAPDEKCHNQNELQITSSVYILQDEDTSKKLEIIASQNVIDQDKYVLPLYTDCFESSLSQKRPVLISRENSSQRFFDGSSTASNAVEVNMESNAEIDNNVSTSDKTEFFRSGEILQIDIVDRKSTQNQETRIQNREDSSACDENCCDRVDEQFPLLSDKCITRNIEDGAFIPSVEYFDESQNNDSTRMPVSVIGISNADSNCQKNVSNCSDFAQNSENMLSQDICVANAPIFDILRGNLNDHLSRDDKFINLSTDHVLSDYLENTSTQDNANLTGPIVGNFGDVSSLNAAKIETVCDGIVNIEPLECKNINRENENFTPVNSITSKENEYEETYPGREEDQVEDCYSVPIIEIDKFIMQEKSSDCTKVVEGEESNISNRRQTAISTNIMEFDGIKSLNAVLMQPNIPTENSYEEETVKNMKKVITDKNSAIGNCFGDSKFNSHQNFIALKDHLENKEFEKIIGEDATTRVCLELGPQNRSEMREENVNMKVYNVVNDVSKGSNDDYPSNTVQENTQIINNQSYISDETKSKILKREKSFDLKNKCILTAQNDGTFGPLEETGSLERIKTESFTKSLIPETEVIVEHSHIECEVISDNSTVDIWENDKALWDTNKIEKQSYEIPNENTLRAVPNSSGTRLLDCNKTLNIKEEGVNFVNIKPCDVVSLAESDNHISGDHGGSTIESLNEQENSNVKCKQTKTIPLGIFHSARKSDVTEKSNSSNKFADAPNVGKIDELNNIEIKMNPKNRKLQSVLSTCSSDSNLFNIKDNSTSQYDGLTSEFVEDQKEDGNETTDMKNISKDQGKLKIANTCINNSEKSVISEAISLKAPLENEFNSLVTCDNNNNSPGGDLKEELETNNQSNINLTDGKSEFPNRNTSLMLLFLEKVKRRSIEKEDNEIPSNERRSTLLTTQKIGQPNVKTQNVWKDVGSQSLQEDSSSKVVRSLFTSASELELKQDNLRRCFSQDYFKYDSNKSRYAEKLPVLQRQEKINQHFILASNEDKEPFILHEKVFTESKNLTANHNHKSEEQIMNTWQQAQNKNQCDKSNKLLNESEFIERIKQTVEPEVKQKISVRSKTNAKLDYSSFENPSEYKPIQLITNGGKSDSKIEIFDKKNINYPQVDIGNQKDDSEENLHNLKQIVYTSYEQQAKPIGKTREELKQSNTSNIKCSFNKTEQCDKNLKNKHLSNSNSRVDEIFDSTSDEECSPRYRMPLLGICGSNKIGEKQPSLEKTPTQGFSNKDVKMKNMYENHKQFEYISCVEGLDQTFTNSDRSSESDVPSQSLIKRDSSNQIILKNDSNVIPGKNGEGVREDGKVEESSCKTNIKNLFNFPTYPLISNQYGNENPIEKEISGCEETAEVDYQFPKDPSSSSSSISLIKGGENASKLENSDIVSGVGFHVKEYFEQTMAAPREMLEMNYEEYQKGDELSLVDEMSLASTRGAKSKRESSNDKPSIKKVNRVNTIGESEEKGGNKLIWYGPYFRNEESKPENRKGITSVHGGTGSNEVNTNNCNIVSSMGPEEICRIKNNDMNLTSQKEYRNNHHLNEARHNAGTEHLQDDNNVYYDGQCKLNEVFRRNSSTNNWQNGQDFDNSKAGNNAGNEETHKEEKDSDNYCRVEGQGVKIAHCKEEGNSYEHYEARDEKLNVANAHRESSDHNNYGKTDVPLDPSYNSGVRDNTEHYEVNNEVNIPFHKKINNSNNRYKAQNKNMSSEQYKAEEHSHVNNRTKNESAEMDHLKRRGSSPVSRRTKDESVTVDQNETIDSSLNCRVTDESVNVEYRKEKRNSKVDNIAMDEPLNINSYKENGRDPMNYRVTDKSVNVDHHHKGGEYGPVSYRSKSEQVKIDHHKNGVNGPGNYTAIGESVDIECYKKDENDPLNYRTTDESVSINYHHNERENDPVSNRAQGKLVNVEHHSEWDKSRAKHKTESELVDPVYCKGEGNNHLNFGVGGDLFDAALSGGSKDSYKYYEAKNNHVNTVDNKDQRDCQTYYGGRDKHVDTVYSGEEDNSQPKYGVSNKEVDIDHSIGNGNGSAYFEALNEQVDKVILQRDYNLTIEGYKDKEVNSVYLIRGKNVNKALQPEKEGSTIANYPAISEEVDDANCKEQGRTSYERRVEFIDTVPRKKDDDDRHSTSGTRYEEVDASHYNSEDYSQANYGVRDGVMTVEFRKKNDVLSSENFRDEENDAAHYKGKGHTSAALRKRDQSNSNNSTRNPEKEKIDESQGHINIAFRDRDDKLSNNSIRDEGKDTAYYTGQENVSIAFSKNNDDISSNNDVSREEIDATHGQGHIQGADDSCLNYSVRNEKLGVAVCNGEGSDLRNIRSMNDEVNSKYFKKISSDHEHDKTRGEHIGTVLHKEIGDSFMSYRDSVEPPKAEVENICYLFLDHRENRKNNENMVGSQGENVQNNKVHSSSRNGQGSSRPNDFDLWMSNDDGLKTVCCKESDNGLNGERLAADNNEKTADPKDEGNILYPVHNGPNENNSHLVTRRYENNLDLKHSETENYDDPNTVCLNKGSNGYYHENSEARNDNLNSIHHKEDCNVHHIEHYAPRVGEVNKVYYRNGDYMDYCEHYEEVDNGVLNPYLKAEYNGNDNAAKDRSNDLNLFNKIEDSKNDRVYCSDFELDTKCRKINENKMNVDERPINHLGNRGVRSDVTATYQNSEGRIHCAEQSGHGEDITNSVHLKNGKYVHYPVRNTNVKSIYHEDEGNIDCFTSRQVIEDFSFNDYDNEIDNINTSFHHMDNNHEHDRSPDAILQLKKQERHNEEAGCESSKPLEHAIDKDSSRIRSTVGTNHRNDKFQKVDDSSPSIYFGTENVEFTAESLVESEKLIVKNNENFKDSKTKDEKNTIYFLNESNALSSPNFFSPTLTSENVLHNNSTKFTVENMRPLSISQVYGDNRKELSESTTNQLPKVDTGFKRESVDSGFFSVKGYAGEEGNIEKNRDAQNVIIQKLKEPFMRNKFEQKQNYNYNTAIQPDLIPVRIFKTQHRMIGQNNDMLEGLTNVIRSEISSKYNEEDKNTVLKRTSVDYDFKNHKVTDCSLLHSHSSSPTVAANKEELIAYNKFKTSTNINDPKDNRLTNKIADSDKKTRSLSAANLDTQIVLDPDELEFVDSLDEQGVGIAEKNLSSSGQYGIDDKGTFEEVKDPPFGINQYNKHKKDDSPLLLVKKAIVVNNFESIDNQDYLLNDSSPGRDLRFIDFHHFASIDEGDGCANNSSRDLKEIRTKRFQSIESVDDVEKAKNGRLLAMSKYIAIDESPPESPSPRPRSKLLKYQKLNKKLSFVSEIPLELDSGLSDLDCVDYESGIGNSAADTGYSKDSSISVLTNSNNVACYSVLDFKQSGENSAAKRYVNATDDITLLYEPENFKSKTNNDDSEVDRQDNENIQNKSSTSSTDTESTTVIDLNRDNTDSSAEGIEEEEGQQAYIYSADDRLTGVQDLEPDKVVRNVEEAFVEVETKVVRVEKQESGSHASCASTLTVPKISDLILDEHSRFVEDFSRVNAYIKELKPPMNEKVNNQINDTVDIGPHPGTEFVHTHDNIHPSQDVDSSTLVYNEQATNQNEYLRFIEENISSRPRLLKSRSNSSERLKLTHTVSPKKYFATFYDDVTEDEVYCNDQITDTQTTVYINDKQKLTYVNQNSRLSFDTVLSVNKSDCVEHGVLTATDNESEIARNKNLIDLNFIKIDVNENDRVDSKELKQFQKHFKLNEGYRLTNDLSSSVVTEESDATLTDTDSLADLKKSYSYDSVTDSDASVQDVQNKSANKVKRSVNSRQYNSEPRVISTTEGDTGSLHQLYADDNKGLCGLGLSSSCENLTFVTNGKSEQNTTKMLHRSRPDLIKGIATQSQEGLPSTSSQSYTDVSGLSQSTSENSLNSSGSELHRNEVRGANHGARPRPRVVTNPPISNAPSKSGLSASRKSSLGEASDSSTPTPTARFASKKKDNKRSDIVSAVTSRLYDHRKKPDPKLEALQAAAQGHDDDEDGDPEELKLCKRARMKLFDLSRKLALANKKYKKTADNDTQTDYHRATIRVREKNVGTDQQGITYVETCATNTPLDQNLKEKKEQQPIIMNQIFMPQSADYIVECGKGIRVQVPAVKPIMQDFESSTSLDKLKAFKDQTTSPIKRKIISSNQRRSPFTCSSEDSLSDDSLELDQEGTRKHVELDSLEIYERLPRKKSKRRSKSRPVAPEHIYQDMSSYSSPIIYTAPVIDNVAHRSFDSLIEGSMYGKLKPKHSPKPWIEKSLLPVRRYSISGTNIVYEYDPNKSIPDLKIYSNLGLSGIGVEEKRPPCHTESEIIYNTYEVPKNTESIEKGSHFKLNESKVTLFNGFPVSDTQVSNSDHLNIPMDLPDGVTVVKMKVSDFMQQNNSSETENTSSDNSLGSVSSADLTSPSETSSEDFIFYDSSKEKERTGQLGVPDRELYTITENSEHSDQNSSDPSSPRSNLILKNQTTDSEISTNLSPAFTHGQGDNKPLHSNSEKNPQCSSTKSQILPKESTVPYMVKEVHLNDNQLICNSIDKTSKSPTPDLVVTPDYSTGEANNRVQSDPDSPSILSDGRLKSENRPNISPRKINWSDLSGNSPRKYLNISISGASKQFPYSIDSQLFSDSTKKDQGSEATFPSEDSITFVFMGPAKQKTSMLMELIRRSINQGGSGSEMLSTERGLGRKSRNRGTQCNTTLKRSVSIDTAMIALSKFAKNQRPNSDIVRTTSLNNLVPDEMQSILEQGRIHSVKEISCQCNLSTEITSSVENLIPSELVSKLKDKSEVETCCCRKVEEVGTETNQPRLVVKDQETETMSSIRETETQTFYEEMNSKKSTSVQTLFDVESVQISSPIKSKYIRVEDEFSDEETELPRRMLSPMPSNEIEVEEMLRLQDVPDKNVNHWKEIQNIIKGHQGNLFPSYFNEDRVETKSNKPKSKKSVSWNDMSERDLILEKDCLDSSKELESNEDARATPALRPIIKSNNCRMSEESEHLECEEPDSKLITESKEKIVPEPSVAQFKIGQEVRCSSEPPTSVQATPRSKINLYRQADSLNSHSQTRKVRFCEPQAISLLDMNQQRQHEPSENMTAFLKEATSLLKNLNQVSKRFSEEAKQRVFLENFSRDPQDVIERQLVPQDGKGVNQDLPSVKIENEIKPYVNTSYKLEFGVQTDKETVSCKIQTEKTSTSTSAESSPSRVPCSEYNNSTWPRRKQSKTITNKPPTGLRNGSPRSSSLRSTPVRKPSFCVGSSKSILGSSKYSCSNSGNWNFSNLSTNFSNSYLGSRSNSFGSGFSDYDHEVSKYSLDSSNSRPKTPSLPPDFDFKNVNLESKLKVSCKNLELAVENDRIRQERSDSRFNSLEPIEKNSRKRVEVSLENLDSISEIGEINVEMEGENIQAEHLTPKSTVIEEVLEGQVDTTDLSCSCTCHGYLRASRTRGKSKSCFELSSGAVFYKHCQACCLACPKGSYRKSRSSSALYEIDANCSICQDMKNDDSYLLYENASTQYRLRKIRTSPRAYMQHLLTLRKQIIEASRISNELGNEAKK